MSNIFFSFLFSNRQSWKNKYTSVKIFVSKNDIKSRIWIPWINSRGNTRIRMM